MFVAEDSTGSCSSNGSGRASLPNEWLISCKGPCENLWSLVAGRRPGCGRHPAPPAFVGCISGLGGRRRQERLDTLREIS